MAIIRIVGFDAALNNFGIAQAYYDTACDTLDTYRLQLVTTEAWKGPKRGSKAGDELRRARHIHSEMLRNCVGMDMCAAEVPSGSQSAKAARSLGIVVGVLAAHPIPMIEVSQHDVKMAAVGNPRASKDQMIDWAVSLYPDLNWPIKSNGVIIKGRAEHLADAIGVLHAAIKTGKVR